MNKYYEYRDNLGNPRDYYNIVNDANTLCKELEEQNKEIERLNNIIGELEKENMYLDNEIGKLNNIVDTLEKTFIQDNKEIKKYNIEHPESPLDNYSRYYLDKLKELKGENNDNN